MAGAAAVNLKEIDLSVRVPSFPGVTGAIVIPLLKGDSSKPQFITNDSQFLLRLTPEETIKTGYDLGHFSALAFLEKSDKILIQRALKDAYFSGASIKRSDATTLNQSLPANQMMADPSAYIFDSNPDVKSVAEKTDITYANDGSFYDISGVGKAYRLHATVGEFYIWHKVTDGANTQTDPALSGTGLQVDILLADTSDLIAAKAQAVANGNAAFSASVVDSKVTITNAVDGDVTDASDVNAGVTVLIVTQGVDEVNLVDECLLIHASSEGVWGDKIGFLITNFADDQDKVGEPDAFLIEVFRLSNQATPIEAFVCSRVIGAKDGFGQNVFVEDVLKASNFIRAVNNDAVDSSIKPKSQNTILFMGGGDDGLAVTDATMITAAQKFKNPNDTSITLFMDAGFAVPSYQIELDNICKNRKDCVALLSTRYSDEISSSYISDLKDYRKIDLNINSSYSTLYTPHVEIKDRFNDRDIFVAPDGYAGAAISSTASNYEMWFPPAGFKRGLINVLDVSRRFEQAEMDVLYNAGINPIRFAQGRGIVIWGQKTLLSRPSSLDRLNVRLLLLVIEPSIIIALEDFLFDLNDVGTRAFAKGRIDSFMERIQAKKGVTDFFTQIDEKNNPSEVIDANEMVVDLFLKPTRSIETIPFRVVLVSTGVSFDEASAAL